MKKYTKCFIVALLRVLLCACNKEPEQEVVPTFIPEERIGSGIVISVDESTIVCDGETGLVTISTNPVDISDIHIDTQISYRAETIENSDELQLRSYEVTYQPLQYVIGKTAEELLSQDLDQTKLLLHIRENINGCLSDKGIVTGYSSEVVSTIKYNTYVLNDYTTKTVNDDNGTTSTLTDSYLDISKDAITKYYSDNYDKWYYVVDDYHNCDITLLSAKCSVDAYYESDGSVIIEGTYDKDLYLYNYVNSFIKEHTEDNSIPVMMYKAVYNMDTLALESIELTVDFSGINFVHDGKDLTNISYDLQVSVMSLSSVSIPGLMEKEAVPEYYKTNPPKTKNGFSKKKKLCVSLLGLSESQININDVVDYFELTDDMCKYVYQSSVNSVATCILHMVKGNNVKEFMKYYVTIENKDLQPSEIGAGNILYTWLMEYGIRIEDYLKED